MMRFAGDMRMMATLDHPNIRHTLGGGLPGETLEAIIERLRAGDPEAHARFSLSVRLEIMQSVLRAIAFAHAKGIIHRDLKPSNILLGRYGEVFVIEWGIAKRIGEVSAALDVTMLLDEEERTARPFRARIGALLGTPAYMSPEQARGDHHALDARSDIFSLSLVFYEWLALRHPFEEQRTLDGLLEAICYDEPAPMGVSVELTRFVHRGLAKERDHRYASVGEMIESLRAVIDGTFLPTCHVTSAKRLVLGVARWIDAHPAATARAITLAVLVPWTGLVATLVTACSLFVGHLGFHP